MDRKYSMLPDEYQHYWSVRVRFKEVDMLGVCNNAVYVTFMEEARIQYLKHLEQIPEGGIFSDGILFFMVHNEIDYFSHAFHDEELKVYTRISYIKNSSYGFDHLIIKEKDSTVVAGGCGVVVCVDPQTRKARRLEDKFLNTIRAFEPRVKILREDL